ncbi:hypothetical protein CC2G_004541, partial [Coprinopsis cinerea AmutBmut pab1-1]
HTTSPFKFRFRSQSGVAIEPDRDPDYAFRLARNHRQETEDDKTDTATVDFESPTVKGSAHSFHLPV